MEYSSKYRTIFSERLRYLMLMKNIKARDLVEKLKIDNLILLASKKPLKSILEKIEILESQKEDIKYRLNLDVTASGKITTEKIRKILNQDIKELKSNSSKIELKNLIKKYIKKIIVGEDNIIIQYHFSSINSYLVTNTVLNTSGRGDPLTNIFKTTLNTRDYIAKTYNFLTI